MPAFAHKIGQLSEDGQWSVVATGQLAFDAKTNMPVSMEDVRWRHVVTGAEVVVHPADEPERPAPLAIRDRPKFADLSVDELDALVRSYRYQCVELKYDGRWVWVHADGETVTLTSRNGTKQRRTFPANGVVGEFVGEYVYGTAWAKSSGLAGAVVLFDCLEHDGEDVSRDDLGLRGVHVDAAADKLGEPFMASNRHFVHEARSLWHRYVKTGKFEGLVFKRAGEPFGGQWARMKRTCTIDYACMGFGESDSGNGVGSVVVGLYRNGELHEVGRLFGLSDAERHEYATNPGSYIGRTVRATGMQMYDSGALRHGTIDSWHEDKPASACTFEAARKAAAGL